MRDNRGKKGRKKKQQKVWKHENNKKRNKNDGDIFLVHKLFSNDQFISLLNLCIYFHMHLSWILSQPSRMQVDSCRLYKLIQRERISSTWK